MINTSPPMATRARPSSCISSSQRKWVTHLPFETLNTNIFLFSESMFVHTLDFVYVNGQGDHEAS
jgi:hypothetical protein